MASRSIVATSNPEVDDNPPEWTILIDVNARDSKHTINRRTTILHFDQDTVSCWHDNRITRNYEVNRSSPGRRCHRSYQSFNLTGTTATSSNEVQRPSIGSASCVVAVPGNVEDDRAWKNETNICLQPAGVGDVNKSK
jgi:hypothetical protein